MAEGEEFPRKVEKLRKLLRERGAPAALIGRRDDFAWLTSGGDSTVRPRYGERCSSWASSS